MIAGNYSDALGEWRALMDDANEHGELDQTARILAEHGSPLSRAEYAVHQAHARYRLATDGSEDRAVWELARVARRRDLTDALMAFDVMRAAGARDTYVISHARALVGHCPHCGRNG